MFTFKRHRIATTNDTRRDHSKPIRSVDEFREIVEYERARANRSGLPFCVLVFEGDGGESTEVVLDRLSIVLCDRLRDTDEVGWVSAGQIAAMLPYTLPADANWLGEVICDQIPSELPRPSFEVLVHPAVHPDQSSRDQPSDHQNTIDHPHGKDRLADANGRMNGANGSRNNGSRALGMERWFAMTMPPWKRMMDIVLASIALFVFSPLMIVIAICIKLMSPGPVMFKQRRTGIGGKVFEMHKFRTMTVTAEADQQHLRASSEQDGPAFKMKDDPRITRIGRFLRKTSLDELPQLWNVLKGEMSLVGPRPLPCHEANACAAWQHRRLDVTPGITCIWQTEGRSRVTFDEWMRMDIDYIEARSFRHDLKLLFRTIWAIASCRGAQ